MILRRLGLACSGCFKGGLKLFYPAVWKPYIRRLGIFGINKYFDLTLLGSEDQPPGDQEEAFVYPDGSIFLVGESNFSTRKASLILSRETNLFERHSPKASFGVIFSSRCTCS